VITAFALGGTTVVTGEAIPRNATVIKSRHMPTHRSMAVIALIITTDMIHRLSGRVAIVVTTIAQYGCPGELTLVMALVTLNITMLTREWKASGKMVVICANC
jgi:hypothetical protein